MAQAATAAKKPVASPYGVPSLRVIKAPKPRHNQKLFPFEQTSLNGLINQLNACSPRVRTAFMKYLSKLPAE